MKIPPKLLLTPMQREYKNLLLGPAHHVIFSEGQKQKHKQIFAKSAGYSHCVEIGI